jgi:hypothetical protein
MVMMGGVLAYNGHYKTRGQSPKMHNTKMYGTKGISAAAALVAA